MTRRSPYESTNNFRAIPSTSTGRRGGRAVLAIGRATVRTERRPTAHGRRQWRRRRRRRLGTDAIPRRWGSSRRRRRTDGGCHTTAVSGPAAGAAASDKQDASKYVDQLVLHVTGAAGRAIPSSRAATWLGLGRVRAVPSASIPFQLERGSSSTFPAPPAPTHAADSGTLPRRWA
jgi:hypothetical protein